MSREKFNENKVRAMVGYSAMKYSENPNYQDYMARKAKDDIEGAKQALLRCLGDLSDKDRVQRADLLQRIGALFFEQKDAAKAVEYYEESESSDPESLLSPYYYAKFLAEKLHQYELAIAKCDSIIAKATASPFARTGDDFGSDDYLSMAKELKQKCLAQANG
jgi:tetratricopeptide (TPR) repeat protein